MLSVVMTALASAPVMATGLWLPSFVDYPNTSACTSLGKPRSPYGQSGDVYKLLGTASSLTNCNAKAAAWINATAPAQRCLSTCWLRAPRNSSDALACYCSVSPTWMPLSSTEVDSALVQHPCTGPGDCSYNGICGADGSCECDSAWGGVRCGELQLLPVDRQTAGFREFNTSDSANVSTWGAPMLWDDDTSQWHGWASEMTHGCGINAWETNSQIVHIVGDSPQGPFQRKDVFAPPFAHEPDVVRGPKGEWVMLYSAYNAVTLSLGLRGYNESALAAAICTNCSNGSTPPQGSPGCPFQRGTPRELRHPFIQMLAIAKNPNGPWKQQELHPLTTGWDWNTALTINPDGSAVALIRGGMVWHAIDYSDNTTWAPVGAKLGGESGQWPVSIEDPYIWKDGNGIYHALAHCFTPFFGVHAFVHPADVPVDFTDNVTAMNWTLGGSAYGNVVNFTDGTSFAFSRRERPHLVWGKGAWGVTPLALTNGVEYGTRANTAYQDAIFTLSQQLKQKGPGR